ncbi:putative flap endonuclease-1-like 5' DNA nuclease [Sphingomonas sp. UYAg733]
MLFNSLGQFMVLALLLIGGVILGLGLHPGGRKWRRRLYEESEAYSNYRHKAEVQIGEGKARIADLEQENAALKEQADKAGPPIAAPATITDPVSIAPEPDAAPIAVRAAPLATSAAVAAFPLRDSGGSGGDDLSRIRGIDDAMRAKLAALDMTSFADIAKLSDEDEMALEQRLDIPAGFILRERWRDQATLLSAGKTEEHRALFWS